MINSKFVKKISNILYSYKFEIEKNNLVFFNHIKEFIERMRNNESLNVEITEDLIKQIPTKIFELAKIISKKILENENIFVFPNEKEIFLISTHLIQIERREQSNE